MTQSKNAAKEDGSWLRRISRCCLRGLTRFLFLWLVPLFKKGLHSDLVVQDLRPPLDSDLSKALADKLERNWVLEQKTATAADREPSLARALVKTYLSSCLLNGVLTFIMCIFCKSYRPFLLSEVIEHFIPGGSVSRSQAYVSAGGVVILSFLIAFLEHHSAMLQSQLGMHVRVACCALLYRKALRLSSASLGQTTAGQLVNLMSNDVSRFDTFFIYIHYLWIMPCQVLVSCILIYMRVNLAALIGVACMLLQTVPLQSFMSKMTSRLREKIGSLTDERVRLMNEIISGIQVIKLYAWERPFEKVVSMARAKEISAITKTSYLRGAYMSFMVFTERTALFITLTTLSLMGERVTSSTVFFLAPFYNTLQVATSIYLPSAISLTAECLVSVKRLEKFLTLEERPDLILKMYRSDQKSPTSPQCNNKIKANGFTNSGYENDEEVGDIEISNLTAGWTVDVPTLNNLSIRFPKKKLSTIIGEVGSGKSSILQLLMKELLPSSGRMSLNGNISYASQEPWLFVATIRSNILFDQPYDHQRYSEVLRVCCLEPDMKQFPRGDQTLVGERGTSLSGGQRARINLARAVYRKADVYLLDDPLSAVDAPVGRSLFSECISKFLRGHTTILVTHQLHYLQTADLIVIIKQGCVENMGKYNELASSVQEFVSLLAQEEKRDQEKQNEERRNSRRLSISANQLAKLIQSKPSEALPEDEESKAEELEAEEQLTGIMKMDVHWRYWRAGGTMCFIVFTVFVLLMGQVAASLCDYWVTFWTNQQSIYLIDYNEERFYNQTEFDIYEKIGPLSTVEYLYIYTVVILLCIFLTLSKSMLFFKVCMNASKRLHDRMFNKILRSFMRFFVINPSGRILNRFSKDIGAVDEQLPRAAMETVHIVLIMASTLTLISLTNVWMLLPILVMLIIFYFIFILYINTAQDIKRLEGITKSPVFSHLSATLNGLTTIRVSGAVDRFSREFDIYQDVHTSAWYQYFSCSYTLGFWLDIVCVIFLLIVAFSFILFEQAGYLSGNVGLAISQALGLTGALQFGVRQIAEVLSQMTNVERVLQYTNVDTEIGLEKGREPTPENWPVKGQIELKNVTLTYGEGGAPVLKGLTFVITSGWKVGIVGRTGAGKSSLISALFRLSNVEGDIKIDGVNTGSIALQDLRTRISIIPQEPVLFSATVRYNLDPFNMYNDALLWEAIEAVELKNAMPSLDHQITEGGSNFSVGQRQLICLARAILRNNQILIMDEATANVDPQTDAFIQRTIRDKFSNCTVLTIAHRLNTIMDSDRILVMEAGCAVEFDHPHLLLQNSQGKFYDLVRETGPEMAANLHQLANRAYISSNHT